MPATVTIRNTRTGKTGQAALREFNNRFKNIPKRVQKAIPKTLYPTVANLTRRFFRDNYIAQEGWSLHSFTSQDYRERKDNFLSRGDTFEIGEFTNVPIIHGSEVFGRRTDTTLNAVGARAGTTVRTDIDRKKEGLNVRINIGIDETKFEGGTRHTNALTGNDTVESKPNALIWFSRQVSPSTGHSIFAKLTRAQMGTIFDYLNGVFGLTIRNVFTKPVGNR